MDAQTDREMDDCAHACRDGVYHPREQAETLCTHLAEVGADIPMNRCRSTLTDDIAEAGDNAEAMITCLWPLAQSKTVLLAKIPLKREELSPHR